MGDGAAAIMDAAEKRMRIGGFNGFSFREIAADVGVKSSSVHYHFPTKENLAAAVVRRYTERAAEHLDAALAGEKDPAKAWTRTFRGTLMERHMCPCVVLGAGALDLPKEVAAEVKRFYQMNLDKMVSVGLSPLKASELLATLIGAMLVSVALQDNSSYDCATSELMRAAPAIAA